MALAGYFLGVFGTLLVYKHLDDDNWLEKAIGAMMIMVGFVLCGVATTG